MKKVLYILQTIAVVMLFGCQNVGEESFVDGGLGDAVRFGVHNPSTRVEFADGAEGLSIGWTMGDNIGISATKMGEPVGCNYPYGVSEISEDGEAKLAALSNHYTHRWAGEATMIFTAYYPHSGVAGEGVDYLAPVALPAVQTQKSVGDYSHLKDLWVMKSEPYTVNGVMSAVELSFRGVYSIVELKLRYADGKSNNRSIKDVQLHSTTAPVAITNANLMLAGNLESDEENSPLAISDGVDSIRLDVQTPFKLSADNTSSVWMVVAPGSHAAGELSVVLNTSDSYRLEMSIADAANFEPNKVYRKEIAVNPADYVKVESSDEPSDETPKEYYAIGWVDANGAVKLLPNVAVDRRPAMHTIGVSDALLGVEVGENGSLVGEIPSLFHWEIEKLENGFYTFSYENEAGEVNYLIGEGVCDESSGLAVKPMNEDGTFSAYYSSANNGYANTFAINAREDGGYNIVLTREGLNVVRPFVYAAIGDTDAASSWRLGKGAAETSKLYIYSAQTGEVYGNQPAPEPEPEPSGYGRL